MKTWLRLIALVAFTVVPACVVYAGDRIKTMTTAFGTDQSQSVDLGPKHKLMTVVVTEIAITDKLPDDHPLQYLSGKCLGSGEDKDGVAKGSGSCVYTNSKGGKFVMTWDISPGSDGFGGNYQLVGTEGNTLGWKGAGRWLQIGPEFSERRYLNRWVGWIEAP